MINIDLLIKKAVEYDHGDSGRIQHFIKVHDLSALIGRLEGLDPASLNILEAAAVLHDIGIHESEKKYGNCNGKNQEIEGPPVAMDILSGFGCSGAESERICYLIGHHHTYDNIQDMDYQILVEADFLVNYHEDGLSRESIVSSYKKIFRTKSGTELCRLMYDID